MGDGYTADQNGIQGLGGFTHDRAADVRAIVTNLQKLPGATEDTLGDGGALGAFTKFSGAWIDELNIIASGLDELGQKFTDTAAHYNATEVHWSHNFQGMAPQS
jgi:hypothetical protein